MKSRAGVVVALAVATAILAAHCGDSGSSANQDGGIDAGGGEACSPGYPLAPFGRALGDVLADETFVSDRESFSLSDSYAPCAAPKLLLVRVAASFCGTCGWHASHTREILDVDPRVEIVDLLVRDEQNLPASKPAVERWRARTDATTKMGIDPSARWASFTGIAEGALPIYAFVDARTMTLRAVYQNPGPDRLHARIRSELAAMDGKTPPSAVAERVTETYFSRDQWDMLREMKKPMVPPPDPTNAFADNPAAAAFGKELFFDRTLSPSGMVSCGTCHVPEKGLSDGLPQGRGVSTTDRRTPSILFAAHSPSQFWDGRADSLWGQALGPFEAAAEYGGSRLFVAKGVFAKYKSKYEALFGATPDLADPRFPSSGKPGDAAYDALASADREAVERMFVNVGKSIAAFERTIRSKPTRVDAYIAGDLGALTNEEKHGFHEFFLAGCAECHFGPRLTNDAFHNIRFPTGRQDGKADIGRSDGIALLIASEFNTSKKWSDAPKVLDEAFLQANVSSTTGAFRTSSLWGVARNSHFGHGGTLPSLDEVVRNYGDRGIPSTDGRAIGETEPWLPKFTEHHRPPIVRFLQLLDDEAIIP
ncbi:MAG: hypothetical protein KBF88_00240 [Polyangiaceae bacterium]|nr:hypothetical protein [Polyangiaceae bacterium]